MINKENLEKYGITGVSEIIHNPSYEQLYEEETSSSLDGYEKGQVSELGGCKCYDRNLYRPISQRQMDRNG